MLEKIAGLIALIKNDPSFLNFLPFRCIIHCEHLAARYFWYEDIMESALEIVSFIRLNEKTYRQSRNVIIGLELDDKPSIISFNCVVRWLSTSNVLSRFMDLM